MCQLTLVNLNDRKLNAQFLSNQLLLNCAKNNKDGTGIFSRKFIFKAGIPAVDYENISSMCLEVAYETEPLLGHVRFATIPKIISKENSHPFDGRRFILAHNGTLDFNAEDKKLSGVVDSEKFLHLLEKIEEENKDKQFSELIKLAVERVDGKFAFLIIDKLEKHYYIVRGKQAELWVTKNENGYVVNTDKNSLLDGIMLFKQSSFFNREKYLSNFSKPELLSENTVFLVKEDGLEKIGEVKETPIISAAVTYYPTKYRGGYDYEGEYEIWENYGRRPPKKEEDQTVSNYRNLVATIYKNLILKGGLSFLELDILINSVFEFPLTGINKSHLTDLFRIINIIKRYTTQEKSELWAEVRYLHCEKDIIAVYKRFELNFPFCLNDLDTIKKVHDTVEEDYSEKYGITV